MDINMINDCDRIHNDTGNAPQPLPKDGTVAGMAGIFKMLSDFTRLLILLSLSGGEKCVCEISQAVDVSQSAVSHQLRLLRTAHLVKTRREGKNIVYRLSDGHIEQLVSVALQHALEENNDD